MNAKVINKLDVGGNTLITINGSPDVKNGMYVSDEYGIRHLVMSVAMVEHSDPGDITKFTTMMIKGKFEAGEIENM